MDTLYPHTTYSQMQTYINLFKLNVKFLNNLYKFKYCEHIKM